MLRRVPCRRRRLDARRTHVRSWPGSRIDVSGMSAPSRAYRRGSDSDLPSDSSRQSSDSSAESSTLQRPQMRIVGSGGEGNDRGRLCQEQRIQVVRDRGRESKLKTGKSFACFLLRRNPL